MSKETRYSEKLECRRCQNVAKMRVVGTISDTDDDDGDETSPPVEYGTIYEVLQCPRCEQVTFRSGFWHDGMESDDWNGAILYPSERQGIEGLPPAVSQEFRAAEQVASISANAYAVLLGRVLDAVCNDRSANGKNLFEKLTDLAARNEIPKNLAEMAQKLRQLRNVGAHADLGALTNEEVPVLAALCKAVLEYVYSAPKLVDKVGKLLAKITTP